MRRFAIALLASAALSTADVAIAAPDAERLATLEKENAALRQEIAKLRAQSARPAAVQPATSAYAKATTAAAPIYKAPPPVVPAGWSGFYVGGNVGLSVARNWSDATLVPPFGRPADNQFSLSPIGAVAGGQIGYNWQFGTDVVGGLEADIQWSGQRDANTCLGGCDAAGDMWTFTQKLTWFGTARARLGWTNGPALFYATGGFAYGNVKTDFAHNFPLGGSSTSASVSSDKSGWTAGGGVEAQLAGNWTGKIEYLYLDLGTVSGDATITTGTLAGSSIGFSSRVRDHVVRAGVNYKFGDPIYVAGAPAAFAKAPPAAMLAGWSGGYFGGNLGWSVARNKTGAPTTFPSGEVGANEQVNLSPTAVVIGGQFGYNWQPAPNWVWGLEADLQQGARDKDKTTCIDSCSVAIAETLTQRISWLGTVRARAGWTNGPSLFYATGGLAYGRIVTDVGFFREPCPLCGPGGINPTLASGTITEDKAGWTVGGGIETRLAGAWTGKVEYLYVDLGTVSGGVVGVAGLQAGVTYGFVSQVRDHVVRAGVNYQLGAGPVVASY